MRKFICSCQITVCSGGNHVSVRKIFHVSHGDGERSNIFRRHVVYFKEGFISHYPLKKCFLKPYSFPFLLTMHHISVVPCAYFPAILSSTVLMFLYPSFPSPYLFIHNQGSVTMNYIFLAENIQLAKRRCVLLVFCWPDLCVLSDMEIKGQKYFL